MFDRLLSASKGYAFVVGRTPERPEVLLSDYPEEWLSRYFEVGLYRHDPIFQAGVSCVANRRAAEIVDTSDYPEFFAEAGVFGIETDKVIVNSIGGNKLFLGTMAEANEIETYIDIVKLDHMDYLISKVDGLTDRQKEILDMFDWGVTTKQATVDLGITASAIDQHKRRIVDALGVANFSAASSAYAVYKWSGLMRN